MNKKHAKIINSYIVDGKWTGPDQITLDGVKHDPKTVVESMGIKLKNTKHINTKIEEVTLDGDMEEQDATGDSVESIGGDSEGTA